QAEVRALINSMNLGFPVAVSDMMSLPPLPIYRPGFDGDPPYGYPGAPGYDGRFGAYLAPTMARAELREAHERFRERLRAMEWARGLTMTTLPDGTQGLSLMVDRYDPARQAEVRAFIASLNLGVPVAVVDTSELPPPPEPPSDDDTYVDASAPAPAPAQDDADDYSTPVDTSTPAPVMAAPPVAQMPDPGSNDDAGWYTDQTLDDTATPATGAAHAAASAPAPYVHPAYAARQAYAAPARSTAVVAREGRPQPRVRPGAVSHRDLRRLTAEQAHPRLREARSRFIERLRSFEWARKLSFITLPDGTQALSLTVDRYNPARAAEIRELIASMGLGVPVAVADSSEQGGDDGGDAGTTDDGGDASPGVTTPADQGMTPGGAQIVDDSSSDVQQMVSGIYDTAFSGSAMQTGASSRDLDDVLGDLDSIPDKYLHIPAADLGTTGKSRAMSIEQIADFIPNRQL
ncbi:MAG: hypothetical protein ACHREM_08850, partial [Polyangiales bacterium]